MLATEKQALNTVKAITLVINIRLGSDCLYPCPFPGYTPWAEILSKVLSTESGGGIEKPLPYVRIEPFFLQWTPGDVLMDHMHAHTLA